MKFQKRSLPPLSGKQKYIHLTKPSLMAADVATDRKASLLDKAEGKSWAEQLGSMIGDDMLPKRSLLCLAEAS